MLELFIKPVLKQLECLQHIDAWIHNFLRFCYYIVCTDVNLLSVFVSLNCRRYSACSFNLRESYVHYLKAFLPSYPTLQFFRESDVIVIAIVINQETTKDYIYDFCQDWALTEVMSDKILLWTYLTPWISLFFIPYQTFCICLIISGPNFLRVYTFFYSTIDFSINLYIY